MLELRRRHGSSVGGGGDTPSITLPSEYQQVEYIWNNTSNCILDSGVVAKASVEIFVDLQVLGSNDHVGPAIVSAWYDNNFYTKTVFVYIPEPSKITYTYYQSENTQNIVGLNTSNRNTYFVSREGLFINDKLAVEPFSTEPSDWVNPNNETYKFFYFRYEARFLYFKCWNIKMYDNGELIRNLIPCYSKSDKVVGMYDIVNDVFYTNAGTGAFIVGPDIID